MIYVLKNVQKFIYHSIVYRSNKNKLIFTNQALMHMPIIDKYMLI